MVFSTPPAGPRVEGFLHFTFIRGPFFAIMDKEGLTVADIKVVPYNLGQIPFGSKVYTSDQVDYIVKNAGLDVGIYKYRGTVRSYDDLPWPSDSTDSTDSIDSNDSPSVGDVYDVEEGYEDSSESIPPGTNWAWNGERWDPLSGSLADYLSKQAAEETYATKTELSAHTGNTSNPHGVTKSQVGLGNVDNTSDVNKPVSTATQTELDKKLDKTEAATTYATQAAVANKVDKVSGKGLSTNDFTNSEKSKLSGIETGAQVNTIYDVFGAYNDSCLTGNAQPESINAPDGPIVLTPMDRLYAYPDMDGNVKLGDFAVNFISEMDIPSRELMSEWQWSVSDPEYAKTSEVQPVYNTDLGEWMLPPESELVTKLGMYIDGGENNDSMATYLTVIGYSVEYEITVDTGLSYADFTNDGYGRIGAHAHFTYADGSTAEIVYDVNVNPLGVYSMEYDHTNNSWRIQVDTPSALPGTSDPFTSEMVAACHAVFTVETETDASDQSTWADPNGLNAGDMMRVFGGVDVYANFTRTSSGTERYLGDVMLPPSPNCNWTRPGSDGYASHFILEIWVPQEGMSGPSFVHSDDDASIMLVDGGISMTAGERNVIEFIELSRDFDTGNRTILARKLPTSGVTEISASAPCDGGGM